MKNSTIKIDLNWVKDFVIRLKIFFNPSYWIMNYPYSAEWDKELNDLMGEHDFKKHSDYYSFLGDKKIWVQNHPYASFTRDCQRPSRITIYKANEKLKSDRVKNMIYPSIDGTQCYLSGQTQTQFYYTNFRVIGDGSLSTGATHKINITINNDITMGNGIPNNWENEIN
jgi:hypothetical protein